MWIAHYLDPIEIALEKGMAAKEVVCSITTGFRSIPSLRNAPGLNPYHATVADIGYGFDAVRGTIQRLRNGESISLVKEMLVFDLDTLRISEQQLKPNFHLVAKEADAKTLYLINTSQNLHQEMADRINEAIKYGQVFLGSEWVTILKRVQTVQAIPRL
ncbi:hypothetical protein BACCIP111895_00924 [Neobacillus rhizosphaerae]|uniref:Alanine racemase N-terminal domain-containing protein n=1 Tax=Neobacillus rhizosphaerae TaxID=2880965 RepID=A0ABM9ENU0_9BACI|nr:hypothetical protein [Neobacillus rhizosphaerae]CAH2713770.1 hypothetical protein BACCIP111895_00924 [Neobacillus rhizosphaerae]